MCMYSFIPTCVPHIFELVVLGFSHTYMCVLDCCSSSFAHRRGNRELNISDDTRRKCSVGVSQGGITFTII